MDVGVEEEGDEVVEQVLEEIGVDLSQAVCLLRVLCRGVTYTNRNLRSVWRGPQRTANPSYARSKNRPGRRRWRGRSWR
jgi:hypothetical protein